MNLKTRYSLIASGVVGFAIISPFIILFVTGMRYDFTEKKFTKTGAISVATQPKGAEIFLNGKARGKSNKTIRFLKPGDYDLKINKSGYFDWQKRLNVRAQYLTRASLQLDQLTMFIAGSQRNRIDENVKNFFVGKNKLVYFTDKKITAAAVSDLRDKKTVAWPGDPGMLEILPSKNEDLFLLFNKNVFYLFDSNKNKLYDITDLAKKTSPFVPGTLFQASEELFKFSDNSSLYQLLNGTVYQINYENNKKTPVLDNVMAFAVNNSSIYAISVEFNGTLLKRALTVQPLADPGQSQRLLSLPNFKSADLLVSPRNQLFIIGDNNLYAASESLLLVGDYSPGAIFTENGKVIFYSANEIGIYDPENFQEQIITRTESVVSSVSEALDLGWIFYISDKKLKSIEVDNRSSQNSYTFAELSGEAIFYLDKNAKNIFLLDNGSLDQIKIR